MNVSHLTEHRLKSFKSQVLLKVFIDNFSGLLQLIKNSRYLVNNFWGVLIIYGKLVIKCFQLVETVFHKVDIKLLLIHILSICSVSVKFYGSCCRPQILDSFGSLGFLEFPKYFFHKFQIGAQQKVLQYPTFKSRIHQQWVQKLLQMNLLFRNNVWLSFWQTWISL